MRTPALALLWLLLSCGPNQAADGSGPPAPTPTPGPGPGTVDAAPAAAPPGGSQADLADCNPARCTGPRMGMPNWECVDGRRGGPACKELGDGTCGWVVVDCQPGEPRSVRGGDAGAAPVVVVPDASVPPAPVAAAPPCGKLPPIATLKTWPVHGVYERYCSSLPNPAAEQRFQPPKRILDLGDGTFITEDAHQGCYRARYKGCHKKCLPADARVATPAGDVPVGELRTGMTVWTRSATGERIAAPIIDTSSVDIDAAHPLVAMTLSDGRSLAISAGHPMADGTDIALLRTGARYDGSEVARVSIRPYDGARTFDILPAGPTGIYWVGGIPVRSTLFDSP